MAAPIHQASLVESIQRRDPAVLDILARTETPALLRAARAAQVAIADPEEIGKILEVNATHLGVLLFRSRNALRECLESTGLQGSANVVV